MKKIDPNFLYYYLTTDEIVYYLNGVAEANTTTFPAFNASLFQNIEIFAPDLATQTQIAQILTSLDDKIELNLQMNQTLEAMAQAIFKEWFVDFNFPTSSELGLEGLKDDRILDEKGNTEILQSQNLKNHNADNLPKGWRMGKSSELGLEGLKDDRILDEKENTEILQSQNLKNPNADNLPKGWRNEPIDENIEFLNGLALQKFPPQNEDDFLPVIKIRELKQGFTNSSDKASTEIPKKYVIYDGDILFSWSGSLEVVLWCEGKGALNQHLFKVSSSVYPKWFYFFWVREYLPLYKSIAEGKATTMGHIQRRHLSDTIINVPNKEIMILANSILSPILDKIQENKIQIQTLTQTRDTLLPKLMSGKITLSEL